jgi:RHS repeat-associated protein
LRTRSTGRETARNTDRTFRYGPYGENTTSEGTQTIPYPFGYKSGYRMPGGNKGEGNVTNVTNVLYHYGQRYYDPTTGRWTQQDPLDQFASPTEADAFNFTGDDPVNVGDPSGLSGDGCGDGDYCKGVYVGPTTSSHRQGEPIGEDDFVDAIVRGIEKWGVYEDVKECFVTTEECEHFAEDVAGS